MIKKLIIFFKPLLIILARTYWFITRPHTTGAKVILTRGNEILLVNHTYGYKPTLPGGGVKQGETPEQAARRELKEELGLDIGNIEYIGSIVSTAEYKHDTVHCFCAAMPHTEISLDNIEIRSVVWRSLDNLGNIGPVTRSLVDLYITKNSLK